MDEKRLEYSNIMEALMKQAQKNIEWRKKKLEKMKKHQERRK